MKGGFPCSLKGNIVYKKGGTFKDEKRGEPLSYFVKIKGAVVLRDEDEDGQEGEENQVEGVNPLALNRSKVDLIAAHVHAVLGHHGGGGV